MRESIWIQLISRAAWSKPISRKWSAFKGQISRLRTNSPTRLWICQHCYNQTSSFCLERVRLKADTSHRGPRKWQRASNLTRGCAWAARNSWECAKLEHQSRVKWVDCSTKARMIWFRTMSRHSRDHRFVPARKSIGRRKKDQRTISS